MTMERIDRIPANNIRSILISLSIFVVVQLARHRKTPVPVCSTKEIPAYRHGHKWLLTGTSEDGYHAGSTTTGLVEQYGSDSIKVWLGSKILNLLLLSFLWNASLHFSWF